MSQDFQILEQGAAEEAAECVRGLIDAWKRLDPRVQIAVAWAFATFGKDAIKWIVTNVGRPVATSPYFWAAVAGLGLGTFIAMAQDCQHALDQ
jgi:hypothetical protein